MTYVITDYTSLQTAIAKELNRSSLTNEIPLWVQQLEQELALEPALVGERDDVQVTLQASPAALPADCVELRSLRYDDGVRFGAIDIVPVARLAAYRWQYGLTGSPRAVAVIGDGQQNYTQLLCAPVPDQAYVALASYRSGFDTLWDGTATSNWVLQKYSGLYLYGALRHSAPWLKDDDRLQTWGAEYRGILDAITAQTQRQRFPVDQPIVIKPRRAIG